MLSVGGQRLVMGRLINKDIVHKNWGRGWVMLFNFFRIGYNLQIL